MTGRAPPPRGPGPAPRAGGNGRHLLLELRIAARPEAVRAALARISGALETGGIGEGMRGTAEIVLAEVLNNIVEHAYAGGQGQIALRIELCPASGALLCATRDEGRPMPGGRLPEGGLPPLEGPAAALPEGGFGWHLIRALATGLWYRREGEVNLFGFRIEAGSAGGD